MFVLFISSVVLDDCDVKKNFEDFDVTLMEEKSSKKNVTEIETMIKTIACWNRLIAMRKTFLLMIHFADHDREDFKNWLWARSMNSTKLTLILNRLIIEVTKTFIWFKTMFSCRWSILRNSLIW